MNTRCLCGHVERVHNRPGTGCEVPDCGCKVFRTVAAPVALVEVSDPLSVQQADEIRAGVSVVPRSCPDTHDVASGYGTLRCDLRHPHPGLRHHDPEHRIIWAPCGDDCGGAA